MFKKIWVFVLALIMASMLTGMGWWNPPDPPEPPPPSDEKVAILMVHGLFGGGYAWTNLEAFLKENGWTDDLLYTPTMSSQNASLCSQKHPEEVAQWVNDIISDHPDKKIALIGHSRGGVDIMQMLWQGLIDISKIKYVITLSGANKACRTTFPPVPADETPGDALYTSIYGDPVAGESFQDCDQTDAVHAVIDGAFNLNMNEVGDDVPYCHSDMRTHPDVFDYILKALKGEVGSN